MAIRGRNPRAFALILLFSLFAFGSAKIFFEERFDGILAFLSFDFHFAVLIGNIQVLSVASCFLLNQL